jgi:superfamily I DNA/RNA helicase
MAFPAAQLLHHVQGHDQQTAAQLTSRVLNFVGEPLLRQAFPAYQRTQDFERVRNGFELLLRESAAPGGTWPEVLDRFEGMGQIALMTVHKSKGLEFHTMVFYGLDDGAWRSLSPRNPEELNSFFVAFTRAKQRAFFTLCNVRGRPITWLETILEPAGLRRIAGASILAE